MGELGILKLDAFLVIVVLLVTTLCSSVTSSTLSSQNGTDFGCQQVPSQEPCRCSISIMSTSKDEFVFGECQKSNDGLCLIEGRKEYERNESISEYILNIDENKSLMWNVSTVNIKQFYDLSMHLEIHSKSRNQTYCITFNAPSLHRSLQVKPMLASLPHRCIYMLNYADELRIFYTRKIHLKNVILDHQIFALHHSQNDLKRSKTLAKDWPFLHYFSIESRNGLSLFFCSSGATYNFSNFFLEVRKDTHGISNNRCDADFGGTFAYKTVTDKDIKNGAVKILYKNLEPGRYCFRVKPEDRRCTPSCSLKYTEILTITDILRETPAVPPPVVLPPVVLKVQDDKDNYLENVAIIAAALVMLVILIIALISYKFWSRIQIISRGSPACPLLDNFALSDTILPSSHQVIKGSVSVFLVYTEDCDLHMKVVLALIKLLQSCNCEVYYVSELRCRSYIQLDPTNWFRKQIFEKKINGKDHKIIWIASEMACLRFDAHLSPENLSVNHLRGCGIDSFYEISFRMIVERISSSIGENIHDYIAIVQLPYYRNHAVDLQGVLSDRRYEVPNMLGQLYQFLYGHQVEVPNYLERNLTEESPNIYIRELVASVEQMISYKQDNPSAIRDTWRKNYF